MKIFVYEHIVATSRPEAPEPLVASLLAEGRAMLNAAVKDCAAIPGAEVRTATTDDETEFRILAQWCDYALIIAPEFDQVLESRARWAVDCGAKLLGPPPDAIALCADKLELGRQWERAGVLTPPTHDFDPGSLTPPVVVKPRDGAGSIETFVIEDQEKLRQFRPARPSVIQPFVGSDNAYSVSFLIGPRQRVALAPCRQDIRLVDGALQYLGGRVLSPNDPVCASIQLLGTMAISAVPNLSGYVGVDVHLDPACVFEINPRLTTSYVGLRRQSRTNLMEMLINVVSGERYEVPQWHAHEWDFDSQGNVELHS